MLFLIFQVYYTIFNSAFLLLIYIESWIYLYEFYKSNNFCELTDPGNLNHPVRLRSLILPFHHTALNGAAP